MPSSRKPVNQPLDPAAAAQQVSAVIKDSAQQIWQAGLGAFTRAQIDGSKTFESLVKEGVDLQRKTQAAAEEKIAQATHKMASLASDLSGGATGQWDKLGSIFEDRVARALTTLGVPSAKDVKALEARIAALTEAVEKLSAHAGLPAADAKPGATARKPRRARPPVSGT